MASLEAVVACLTHLLQGVDGAAAAEEVQVAVGWMASVGGQEDDWGWEMGKGGERGGNGKGKRGKGTHCRPASSR